MHLPNSDVGVRPMACSRCCPSCIQRGGVQRGHTQREGGGVGRLALISAGAWLSPSPGGQSSLSPISSEECGQEALRRPARTPVPVLSTYTLFILRPRDFRRVCAQRTRGGRGRHRSQWSPRWALQTHHCSKPTVSSPLLTAAGNKKMTCEACRGPCEVTHSGRAGPQGPTRQSLHSDEHQHPQGS